MTPKEYHVQRIKDMVKTDIETLEDGYKVWWPLHGTGYLSSFDLRVIADYLDELNKDWDAIVQAQV